MAIWVKAEAGHPVVDVELVSSCGYALAVQLCIWLPSDVLAVLQEKHKL